MTHGRYPNRLPSGGRGLRATECHETFKYEALSIPHWSSWYESERRYTADHDEVIGRALGDPTWSRRPEANYTTRWPTSGCLPPRTYVT